MLIFKHDIVTIPLLIIIIAICSISIITINVAIVSGIVICFFIITSSRNKYRSNSTRATNSLITTSILDFVFTVWLSSLMIILTLFWFLFRMDNYGGFLAPTTALIKCYELNCPTFFSFDWRQSYYASNPFNYFEIYRTNCIVVASISVASFNYSIIVGKVMLIWCTALCSSFLSFSILIIFIIPTYMMIILIAIDIFILLFLIIRIKMHYLSPTSEF